MKLPNFLLMAAFAVLVEGRTGLGQVAFAPPVTGISLSPLPRFVGSGQELADVNGDGRLDVAGGCRCGVPRTGDGLPT